MVTPNVTAMDWSKAVDQKTRMLLEHCLARSAIGRVGRCAARPACQPFAADPAATAPGLPDTGPRPDASDPGTFAGLL